MKKSVLLLACACSLAPAAAPAAAQEPAGTGGATAADPAAQEPAPSGPRTAAPVREASPRMQPAGEQLQRAYRRWRRTLDRHGLWRGRDLMVAARTQARPPAAGEVRESIHRMKRRFHRFVRSPRGRAVRFAAKVRTIPTWGRRHLRSIAWCESRNNHRAVGGGGAFRGLYQFTFGTWRVVGGAGDPAAAPRPEQTWRAWLLLSRHGSHHWPVCG